MRLRYPASAGRLPPQASLPIPSCHTAIPFASIGLGLGLAEVLNNGHSAPLRIRALPGTQQQRQHGRPTPLGAGYAGQYYISSKIK